MLDGQSTVPCKVVRVFLITPKFRICGTLTLFCPVGTGPLSPRTEAVKREAGAVMVWHVSHAYKIYPPRLKLCNFMMYLQCQLTSSGFCIRIVLLLLHFLHLDPILFSTLSSGCSLQGKFFFCNWKKFLHTCVHLKLICRGADKSLARPGRKKSTVTEHFDVHISYL